jgi:hypothetical protein
MSLGATTSAPARACTTAILASTSMVASLSTSNSPSFLFLKIPQWPWSVYSSTQTSVITTSSGAALFISATARGTGPSASRPLAPRGSFVLGRPKRIAPPMPCFTSSLAQAPAAFTGSCETPGIVPMGRGSSMPAWKKNG